MIRFKMLFGGSLVLGLTTLSIAMGSVPSLGRITDDTAIHERLSEIRVSKQTALDFDASIARLARVEGRYRETLPSLAENPRLRGPAQRISRKSYRYTGAKTGVAIKNSVRN